MLVYKNIKWMHLLDHMHKVFVHQKFIMQNLYKKRSNLNLNMIQKKDVIQFYIFLMNIIIWMDLNLNVNLKKDIVE